MICSRGSISNQGLSVKNQRSLNPIFLLFSFCLLAVVIYIHSQDPFHWFKSKGEDFIVQWLVVRTFAKENLSPYLPVVQTTTEEFVYGSREISREKALKFSSPLYSVIFILPFALIKNVQVAGLVWMIFSGIILIANTVITLRLTSWKPPVWLLFLGAVFSLVGYHNFQALTSGSTIILSSWFIFTSLLAVRFHRYELAGMLLAMSTIQPRAVLLVVFFILFWAVSKRLWGILFWFLASLALLFVSGTFFIPDWLIQYLRVIWNFREFYPVITPVVVFSSELPGVGRQLGWGMSLLMILILVIEWLAARGKDFNWFLWTVSLTLVVSPFTGIPASPKDFVLLQLPLSLVLAVWDQRFLHLGKWMAGFSLLVLFTGLWWIFFRTSVDLSVIQQNQIFLFPMPLLLLIGLYWVRWRFVRPPIAYVEDIRAVDML